MNRPRCSTAHVTTNNAPRTLSRIQVNKLSLIICTHNPRREYFDRCLGALRAQTLPSHDWELLIVDNCSAEPVNIEHILSYHPGAKVIREEVLGLTPARLRGIREATGDVLVFVDDDNVLDADFLQQALLVAA